MYLKQTQLLVYCWFKDILWKNASKWKGMQASVYIIQVRVVPKVLVSKRQLDIFRFWGFVLFLFFKYFASHPISFFSSEQKRFLGEKAKRFQGRKTKCSCSLGKYILGICMPSFISWRAPSHTGWKIGPQWMFGKKDPRKINIST